VTQSFCGLPIPTTGSDVPPIPFSPNLDKAWQVNSEKVLASIEKLAAYWPPRAQHTEEKTKLVGSFAQLSMRARSL
jgi:hypothetical protein